MEGVIPTVSEDEEKRNEDEEEGDTSELVVLDPSHPLMERVQAALSEQLQSRNTQLEIELREKTQSLKVFEKQREEIGVELYGVQQQLARQQMLIEKEQDLHSTVAQLRHQREHVLTDVRNMYKKVQDQLKLKLDQATNLRMEMETTAVRLKYLSEAHKTVQEDIALTIRATEKTMSDMSKAQDDKLKQDFFVNQLTQQVDRLEEQIALTNAQCHAQAQECKAMKEALAEAAMELEALGLEKKKLIHQWSSCLIGMRRRDEAYSTMVAARNNQQQQIHSMNTELDNYKKSVVKEQEYNEQLTLLLHKVETDINHVKRFTDQCMIKIEAFRVDYMTYTRALQETEQALTVVTGEGSMKRNELSALRTQIEREAAEKHRLEDAVMENMMQRLTMDKATKYSKRSLEKLHSSSKKLEVTLANVENQISQTMLEISNVTSLFKRLQKSLDDAHSAIEKQNDLISNSETEINHNNALIERKQTQIDQLNKKIDGKISKLGGGEDLGPWEMKIDDLQKRISDSMEDCAKMQQHWLRQQNELVKKTSEMDELTKSIGDLQKEELVLLQKKMRLDGELMDEQKNHCCVKHNIESLQKDMVRLNQLITDKKGEQNELEQNNSLLEKDFVSALKEAEFEFLQLQSKTEQLKEEKERLLNSLVESEHQIMLWERKIKLAKEMKDSVDSETGQAEIKAMKAEIHRMKVRYSQLKRQQETMIQDMEKAIYRRDTIIQKSDAHSKSGKTEQTQGYLKKKMADVKRKVKQTYRDVSNCEKDIEKLMESQSNIVKEIQEKQEHSENTKINMDSLHVQLKDTEKAKQLAMSDLLFMQSRVKHLMAAKENRYHLLHKSIDTRFTDIKHQKEKLQSLWSVVQKLENENSDVLLSALSIQIVSYLKKIQGCDVEITVS